MVLPKCALLGLPRELRDMVYRLALITPPKWEQHHRPQCSWAPRSADIWERPTFTFLEDWGEVNINDPVDKCGCSGRPGLGLLLTCRQIHAEAAPLFWQESIFSFPGAKQLAQEPPTEWTSESGEDTDGDIRNQIPRRRFLNLIHHIIVSPYIPVDDYADVFLWHYDDEESAVLWKSISCFRGLKILELYSAIIDSHSDQLHGDLNYIKGLLDLKDVEVRDIGFVKYEAPPSTPHGQPKATNRMWLKFANRTTIGELMELAATDASWTWRSEAQLPDVVDAMSKQVVKWGAGDETTWISGPWNDERDETTLELRDGQNVLAKFFGLPLGRERLELNQRTPPSAPKVLEEAKVP